jgi:hypothetical protein
MVKPLANNSEFLFVLVRLLVLPIFVIILELLDF